MKNILITGGLGYIGGRIASFIKEKKPDINIFLTTRNKNKELPSWTNHFTTLQMNLFEEESINNCLKDKNIETIIHLAAVNEIDSMDEPELAIEVNTKGTYKLLKIAEKNNVNRFIYFSTFHVYGELTDSIITENTITRPVHPYAITHLAAENFVNYFRNYKSINTLIFRLSNAYGYPMDIKINRWTLVCNDLCREAVTTREIILKTSGKQYRNFISLHDVSRAVFHFIYDIPGEWGDGIYNLGGNYSIPILELARKIADVYKMKYKKEISEIKINSETGNKTIFKPINYCIEKLMKTGFTFTDDMIPEIEKTMNLCEEFTA